MACDFSNNTAIVQSADQVLGQLLNVVKTPYYSAGSPWKNKGAIWNFDNRYSGLALYGDLVGSTDSQLTALDWVARW